MKMLENAKDMAAKATPLEQLAAFNQAHQITTKATKYAGMGLRYGMVGAAVGATLATAIIATRGVADFVTGKLFKAEGYKQIFQDIKASRSGLGSLTRAFGYTFGGLAVFASAAVIIDGKTPLHHQDLNPFELGRPPQVKEWKIPFSNNQAMLQDDSNVMVLTPAKPPAMA